MNKPHLAQNIRILTTNLILVQTSGQFLERIYATEAGVDLKREGRVIVDLVERVKLFTIEKRPI